MHSEYITFVASDLRFSVVYTRRKNGPIGRWRVSIRQFDTTAPGTGHIRFSPESSSNKKRGSYESVSLVLLKRLYSPYRYLCTLVLT